MLYCCPLRATSYFCPESKAWRLAVWIFVSSSQTPPRRTLRKPKFYSFVGPKKGHNVSFWTNAGKEIEINLLKESFLALKDLNLRSRGFKRHSKVLMYWVEVELESRMRVRSRRKVFFSEESKKNKTVFSMCLAALSFLENKPVISWGSLWITKTIDELILSRGENCLSDNQLQNRFH